MEEDGEVGGVGRRELVGFKSNLRNMANCNFFFPVPLMGFPQTRNSTGCMGYIASLPGSLGPSYHHPQKVP